MQAGRSLPIEGPCRLLRFLPEVTGVDVQEDRSRFRVLGVS